MLLGPPVFFLLALSPLPLLPALANAGPMILQVCTTLTPVLQRIHSPHKHTPAKSVRVVSDDRLCVSWPCCAQDDGARAGERIRWALKFHRSGRCLWTFGWKFPHQAGNLLSTYPDRLPSKSVYMYLHIYIYVCLHLHICVYRYLYVYIYRLVNM